MSEPRIAPRQDAAVEKQISTHVAEVNRELKRLGIDRADRKTLTSDLRQDLRATAAGGADPTSLVREDPADFARALAEANSLGFDPRDAPAEGVLQQVANLFIGLGTILGLMFVSSTALIYVEAPWLGMMVGGIELMVAWRVTPPAGARALRWVTAGIGAFTFGWSTLVLFAT